MQTYPCQHVDKVNVSWSGGNNLSNTVTDAHNWQVVLTMILQARIYIHADRRTCAFYIWRCVPLLWKTPVCPTLTSGNATTNWIGQNGLKNVISRISRPNAQAETHHNPWNTQGSWNPTISLSQHKQHKLLAAPEPAFSNVYVVYTIPILRLFICMVDCSLFVDFWRGPSFWDTCHSCTLVRGPAVTLHVSSYTVAADFLCFHA